LTGAEYETFSYLAHFVRFGVLLALAEKAEIV